ncbi:MAG TPA: GAF domain-containing protein [Gemmatimonadales bacterium]|nr:GAF domain-containing protein [Gemmatimonadales bacterium]
MNRAEPGGALPTEVLAAIAEATARLLEPAALYDVLHAQVARLVECDAFYVALWDPATERLRFVAHTDRGERIASSEAPLGRGPTSWVVRNRRVLTLDHPEAVQATRGAVFGTGELSQSAVHAPMLLGDRLIGVLSAQSYRPEAYDEGAVRVVAAIAAHAAIAIEAARIAVAAEAALAGSEALRALAHDLSTLGTLDATVERGLEAALAVGQATGAMIAGRPGEQMPGLVVLGSVGSEARLYRIGDVLGERDPQMAVARSGAARSSADLEREPEAAPDPRRPRPHRPGAMLPMRFGSILTGVLTVSGPDADWLPPGPDTMQLLQAVADQVAAAISGLRLRGELLTRLDQIDALGRVAHALTGVEDADRTTHFLAEEGMRVFGAQRSAVFLLQRAESSASCLARLGLSAEYAAAFERQFHALPMAPALLRGEAVFTEHARRDVSSPMAAAAKAEGYASAAFLPLVFANETIGVLTFFHDRPREYSSEERRLAVAFADQAALAIGKSRLFDQVSRSRREWQTAFDGAGTGLAIVDADGLIVRANRFIADLAGVAVTEIVGRQLRAVFVDAGDAREDPLTLSAGSGTGVTDLIESLDGRSLVVTATPLPEGGHVVAVDDVSQVVRLEQRFRLVVEAAHDAIVLADEQGQVVYANAAAVDLFGTPAEGLTRRTLAELLPGDTTGAGGSRRFESQVVRPDGGERLLAVSLAPLGVAEGAGGAVALMRDVTREWVATDNLRRSEARYRALFDTVPVAIFTLDEAGALRSVNPSARALAGFDTASRLADFLVPAEVEYVQKQLRTVRTGEPREFVMHLRRPDGAVREAAVVAVPAAGEEAGAPLVLAIARDVTDEQRLREQLGHTEKLAALGRLVSGVAHELNNPLAGISALAQALILDEPLDEGSRRVVESIRGEATRAAQIVTDLLTFARQRPLRRTALDLGALTREVLAAGGERLGRWTVECPADLPAAHADPDQLRQVVLNLLSNGAHAMRGAGGSGTVRIEAVGEAIRFEAADAGPGIPPEVMARIFEPFFTTKPVGEGTGLGLSISHGIVRAHGGDIRAENRPGGGARIWFELPRHPGR